MAKFTISIECQDEVLLDLLNKILAPDPMGSEDFYNLFGFIARIIMPDSLKANFAIGIVDNPAREGAILQTIFGDEARCQMLYNDLTPDFAEALLFKFKHCYNDETGLHELNETEEQDLLSMLAKVYEA